MDYDTVRKRVRQLAEQKVIAGQEANTLRNGPSAALLSAALASKKQGGLSIGGKAKPKDRFKSFKEATGGLLIGGNPWSEFVTLYAEERGVPLREVLSDHEQIRKLDKAYRKLSMKDKMTISDTFSETRGGTPLKDAARMIQEEKKKSYAKGARKNKWVKFLKEYEASTGVPYSAALQDPEVRRLYRDIYG